MAELLPYENHLCEWQEFVPVYALGSLTGEEKTALEQHLAQGCAKCSAELSRAGESLEKLAKSSPATMPAGARERFLTRLQYDRVPEAETADPSIIFNESGVLISRSEAKPWQGGEVSGICAKALLKILSNIA